MDILLDSEKDLRLSSGDLSIGTSEAQDAQLLLESHSGNWPTTDLGLGDGDYRALCKERGFLPGYLEQQLKSKGFKIKLSENDT